MKHDMLYDQCFNCVDGVYIEISAMDDTNGVVHCSECGHQTKRWINDDEKYMEKEKQIIGVYIVEKVDYDGIMTVGVFSSAEKASKAVSEANERCGQCLYSYTGPFDLNPKWFL